jgi:phenylacetate-CoA ligase
MMIVRGVNIFPSQIEEIILKDQRLAPHFVIELRRADRLDEITVVVEARADADAAIFATCERDLAQRIKALIGVTAGVRTVKPGTVERSIGKARRVIDLRPRS